MRLALLAVLALAACDNSRTNNPAELLDLDGYTADAGDGDGDAAGWTYDHDCGKTCWGAGKCGYVPATGKCIAVSQADCWRSEGCQLWTGTKPGQSNSCCLREDIPSCGHCLLGTDAWNGVD